MNQNKMQTTTTTEIEKINTTTKKKFVDSDVMHLKRENDQQNRTKKKSERENEINGQENKYDCITIDLYEMKENYFVVMRPNVHVENNRAAQLLHSSLVGLVCKDLRMSIGFLCMLTYARLAFSTYYPVGLSVCVCNSRISFVCALTFVHTHTHSQLRSHSQLALNTFYEQFEHLPI